MAEITVDYIDHMGSDLTVVNSARVSFDKESEWLKSLNDDAEETPSETSKELKKGDKRLISYLAHHDHWTPFSHPQITLRETVPIFVARQRFKHMIGFTYNEISRRYVKTDPSFYAPGRWRLVPEGSVKQGSGDDLSDKDNEAWQRRYDDFISVSAKLYEDMLEGGLAPEMARMVLPQSMMTSYYVTGSLAAFARMVRQRKDSHAQNEIQDLALKVDEIIAPLYPVIWNVLVNGKENS